MADQTFRDTQWTYNPTNEPGVVFLPESMPDWQKRDWLKILGVGAEQSPPFKLGFRQAFGSDGSSTWALNSDYFADMPTAQAMADKYGDGTVIEQEFGGVGGIFSASQKEYHIKLKDGRLVNAGLLAATFVRNPEDHFPGLADKLIRAALG